MAITERQAIMVIHPEGITTSAPQASSAHSLFVVLKPLHPGGGGQDEGALLANKEARPLGTSTVGFPKLSSISLSAMAGTNNSNQLWNLPAESTCKSITVTLDNNNMWNEFCRCRTEMILTKQGRRMFPYCRFRISGLEPFQRYTLVMDMHPVDNHRYKWSDRRWETNGKGDPHILRSFVHPESPATGLDWMQNPVSFYKLKLTNNPSDQEGHIIINSMHRYLPRLHIIPADKATDVVQLNGPDVITFSFPQTEFFAVTAYQNLCITQLKIDYNPFAKGFRDATSSRSCKPKNGLSTETVEGEGKPSKETTTLNNLKTLFAKRNAADKVLKGQSLPATPDENLKAVNGDSPKTSELEKSSSKKRPWPEGLSELIKGAHVKVKRISLEKLQDGSSQQMTSGSCPLPAEELKKEAASKDCKMEDQSITLVNKEDLGIVKKPKQESETVENVETEGPKIANTVSVSKPPDSSPNKNTTELCSKTTTMQMNSSSTVSLNTSINEKVDTTLSETATKTDGRETSQSLGKPPDCGEVKKKRAEPVPLPLLALFLQQLKSKTRPSRPKSKCETSSSPSQTDKACKMSLTEKLPPSTESPTQSYTQPVASLTSETLTSSILTCTVSNTTVSPCVSLLPATSSPVSLSTSPTLPDIPSPSRPSLSLVDPVIAPDPALAVHKAASTLDSDVNVVPQTKLVSQQEDAPAPSSPALDNIINSFLSATAPDTNIPNVLSDAPSAISSSSSPKTFPATKSDSPKDDLVCSTVTTESGADPALDACTDPCADFFPEAPYQSPLSDDDDDDGDDIPFSPSSPLSTEFSLPSPAPSSPDPFPPGLFSERPIPPRKSLDPFPPCLLYDRPRPFVDTYDTLPQSLFITKPTPPGESKPVPESVSSEVSCSTPVPEPCIPKETNLSIQDSTNKKSRVKPRKGGKLKQNDDAEVIEGPIPVPMQPSLEDVEGQLFVSFMSKKALEIHLGDDAKEEALQKSVENKKDEGSQNIEERIEARIEALEKDLLRDLKIMKHRQVIHPVLQAVGLKLHLLDLSLAIDLQYLGVCLPIPPPAPLHGESSGCSTSSQVPFVSRTGKTTDITKIKGWRDKFTSSSSSSLPGVGTSSDAGQKNLSAFCSDMLDEYLESEGKLIDERAASFSQAVVTPVAYQLPTKSTSYVRTLDSVLKKQAPPTTTATFKPSLTSRKSYRSKELTKLGEIRSKKSKSGAAKTASNTDIPSNVSDKDDSKVEGSSSKKSIKSGASKAVYSDPSAPFSLSPSKKSAKVKTRRGSRNSQASSLADGKPGVNSISMANVAQDSASSTHGGRMTGLSKTLVKLLDVEDGAVWKGRRRTCITEERAAIALSFLVTSTVKNNPSAIIRRRAPPCLNDFCRLGCVCASLAQERRQHHCGKPQCMLGCDCLRRKVVLLKHSKDEHLNKGAQGQPDENLSEMAKKKRRRKAYILSGPDPAPEPAIHVKRLWDQKSEADSECLFIPTPARPPRPVLISPELQQDLETFLHPMRNKVMNDGGLRLTRDNESCARMRPFCRKNKSHTGQQTTKGEARLGQEDFIEDIEEGELRPPVLSGPTKRLEIVSKCKWVTAGSRNVVLRVVCERMAQDRLKQPFWVGKYQIQPISKTDEGSTVTYKVSISQPRPVKNDLKKEEENEKIKQLEAQLIKTIGKSEVKGLPLLSQVTPAGLLKAEKKIPGASGQISVNGKSYPQAKLELGQMGALHPANRLAAYITGRVCLDNPNATKTADTAVITASTPMACTTITTAVATTTSVTSTCSSAGTTVKPIVTKPPVGTVFTQVVINHMNSQQQKLPSTSAPQLLGTIKHLFKPPSHSLMTGVTEDSVFSNTPPKASMASWAPATPGPTDGHIHPVDTALPVSGTAAPGKTFVLTPTGSHATTPGAGVRLMEPVTSTQPPVPGQKMVFQMLKTATGGTMYRNPNGQLIQLVPLSQFRALNPNFLIPKQTTIVRFPSPTASKPQNGSSVPTITSSTPTTSTATLRQALTPNAIHSAANLSTTTVTSSVTEKPVISLSALSSMSNKPGMVNIAPGFVSNTAKSILKIVTQNLNTDPKQSIITVKTSPSTTQSASNIAPASESIVLITPTSSQKSQNLDLKKSVSNVKVGSVPTEGTQKDCPSSSSSKQDSENVVLEDHCYTFETKRTSTSCEKPGDPADASDPTNASKSNMLPKELLEFGPIEEDEVSDAEGEALGSDVRGEAGEDTEEVEIDSDSTELTEDSDMYNNLSEPSDQEDLHIDTDSDNGKKNKQKRDSVDAKMPDLCEKDDELVDVETFEKDENTTASLVLKQQENQQGQRAKEETEDEFLQKKKKQEKERRSTLRERFHNMQITLNLEESKVSKMTILRLAREEINTLRKQSDQLVNMQKKLSRKKAYYLQLASQISGKTEKSISQKLDEIIIKQKFLEGQHRAKDTSPHLTQPVPKSVVWDHLTKRKRLKSKDKVKDISRRHAQLSPNSKPVYHSITKQKKGGRKDISSKKKALDSSEKETNRRPTQLGMKTLSASQSRTRVERSAQLSRERTRPNILSRSKSQTLPESPAKEQAFVPQVIQAVVPCNQIITISNPLQPIGITSLGERQSTTPGVASVSISVPAISHPIRVENPVSILQPQVLTLASSPLKISSPVKTVNLPKISSVVSLVPPEKRLNTPPVILQKTDLPPAIQTQESCSPVHTDDQQNPTPSNGGAPVVEGQGLDKQALEVVFKPLKQNAKVSMGADVTGVQKEEGKTANSEVEAENLMSLLDELVFLNQQLNDEPSQPQGGDNSLAEEETVRTGLLPEKDAGVDRDDERSLSPLFLRLDEDLMATTTSKDEMDDIPPKVDDLVKVIFGSDSPPSSSESELVVGTNDDGTNVPTCHAKNDAPSPPPLLQMKAGGGGTTANSSKEQASLSWRPMPKLAPLGLKTPEAGQPKATEPSSKPATRLHSAHT